MKLFLSNSTAIDPIANTSSTRHSLEMFVNSTEEYSQIIAILQKGIDALKGIDPKSEHRHRISVELNVVPAPKLVIIAPDVKVAADIKAVEKAKAIVHPAFEKPADKHEAHAQEMALKEQSEQDALLQAELDHKLKELELLQAKVGKKPEKKSTKKKE